MGDRVSRQWRLAARPAGMLKESDFVLREEAVPALEGEQVLVRNIYLSLDPTNRIWVNQAESYLPPIQIGEIMRGFAIGVVEESRNSNFHAGDIVQGLIGWQEYAVSNGSGLRILPKDPTIPLTAHFGLFGHIGTTAYFGLLDIGKPKPGETLVVSAAAGAVGSLVGQIGKIKGCRVVGIAGTDEKCRWIKEDLGFDAAINYKTQSVLRSLRRHCSGGVDIYFDNVGGKTLDAVLSHINLKARIVLCGLISQYNATTPEAGLHNISNVLVKRARMEGFIVLDYEHRVEEAVADLTKWLAEGKIQYRIDVVDGLEQAPNVVNRLFDGSNKGKLIVRVSDEPSL
ncbi:MAG: zinc-binding dehydrogenase [Candidatus Latescibacteria bacterium]|nr:zinc-binding dehydrogenase [Candidatus Latescibacterota bacterium]NIO27104.1 zinc-binding dehydrogenase [Candidatus Latescibacterota bacterium]NIO54628.1 zinc-binding dehydrogenase [Candidatus Latescibacterota bacterium]NIT00711.1 zinc-binding dehydrogenase [Candidatus Latescibacterota bacterium]NIT37634.1 zinc-binding dehydrogenase [Candidatus Latescibacterota bacterium]